MLCSDGCSWVYDGPADDGDPRRVLVACDQPFVIRCRTCQMTVVCRCGTSRPSLCEPCSTAYRGRVAKVAGSGYVHSATRTYFVTLTAPGAVPHRTPWGEHCRCTPVGGTDLRAWNASCGRRFNRWLTYLRRAYGHVEYFRAVEVQRRGALHVHAIIRLPEGFPPPSTAALRELAIACGFGHSVDLQAVQHGHAAYVAKYVAKAADQRGDVPWYGLIRQEGRPVVDRDGVLVGYVFRNGDLADTPRRWWPSWSPSYRTWSASRGWGRTMAELRAAQAHWQATLATLDYAAMLEDDPEACAYRVPLRPDGHPPGSPPGPAGCHLVQGVA